MKNDKSKEVTNVEFGMEFGDMNSAKFYELAFSNQKENKPSQKEKRKK